MKKVYCYDCSLFHRSAYSPSDACGADLGMKDTPYAKVKRWGECEVLNKDNKCSCYTPKKVSGK